MKPKIYIYQIDLPDEPLFYISNLWRVRSHRYNTPYILPTNYNQWWYEYFQFRYNNKRVSLLVHRAVMLAHVWEPKQDHEVNHIDFNRQNNHLENLEYTTRQQNVDHSQKAGRCYSLKWPDHHFYKKTWKSHPKSQPIVQLNDTKQPIHTWESANLAALHFNGNRSHISRAIRTWGKAYWFYWKKA